MSALAQSARVASPRREGARRPVAGGLLWIFVVAALLAGVVAVNVFVLQLK